MTPNRHSARRRVRRLLVVGVVLAAAVTTAAAGITATLGHQAQHAPSPPSAAQVTSSSAESPRTVVTVPSTNPPRSRPRGALGEADGAVPDGVTVFDDAVPAVARLDPDLLEALRRAADEARKDGITFYVNSGWRSAAYQDRLLREAVATYGSPEAAARWVATAQTSPHVSGDAIDLGHPEAATWLSRHGAGYGLCQTYRNEPWHYELRPGAIGHRCPAMFADPTEDPRMQR